MGGGKIYFLSFKVYKKKRQGVRSKFDHFHNKIVYKDFKYHKKMILSPAIFFLFYIYLYIFLNTNFFHPFHILYSKLPYNYKKLFKEYIFLTTQPSTLSYHLHILFEKFDIFNV